MATISMWILEYFRVLAILSSVAVAHSRSCHSLHMYKDGSRAAFPNLVHTLDHDAAKTRGSWTSKTMVDRW